MNLTPDNTVVGMFVHEGTIMGNLRVQVITEADEYHVQTEYLQPAPTGYNTSYWWDMEYHSPKYLKIIPDPVRFLAGTPNQARYVMEHDRFGLGQRVYDACWNIVAIVEIIWKLRSSDPWKEKIDRKTWQMTDYYVPLDEEKRRIRQARGWSKDRMFNGQNFWCVVYPNGGRDEWTNLRTCLRRTGLWFDDSKYLKETNT